MGAIFTVLFSFPSVFFTVLTALALVYWVFVIIGALDIDSLGAAAGAKEGAIDGAVKGAMEGATGAAKGVFEGAAGAGKGAMEGAADAIDGDIDVEPGLLSFLKLRNAPVTVVASLFAIFGTLLTGLWGLTFGIPSFLVGVPIFLGSCVLSLLLTSVVVRPLGSIFQSAPAAKSKDFVGKIATISTGRVTDRFGQAILEDGGAGLILEVRDNGKNDLKRGDRVVLVHFDKAREAFEIEKMPDSISAARLRVDDASIDELARLEAEAAADPAAAERGRRDGRA